MSCKIRAVKPVSNCIVCYQNNQLLSLTCKHEFCENCLESMNNKSLYNCPLCRTDNKEFLINRFGKTLESLIADFVNYQDYEALQEVMNRYKELSKEQCIFLKNNIDDWLVRIEDGYKNFICYCWLQSLKF